MVIFRLFMEFIHPGVLYFLPVLGVPLLIHLFNFRRYQKVYFTNVSSLEQFAKEHRSRNRLKEIFLMAVRMLTLLFLILAFSGLKISGTRSEKNGRGEIRLMEWYIDNSQSMNVLGSHNSLLEEAKKKISELSNKEGSQDGDPHLVTQYALLTNDFSGHDFEFLEKEEFLNRLSRVQSSVNHKTIHQILERFREMNSLNPTTSKIIGILSDFQTNLVPEKSIPISIKIRKFDSLNGAKTHFYVLKPITYKNYFIDSVWNLTPIQKVGENHSMVIRIGRSGNFTNSEPEISLPIKLYLNSEIKSIGLVRFKNSQSVLDTLHFLINKSGAQEVKITIDDQPIHFDNTFFAAWNVAESMNIYTLHSTHTNPFINAVYATDPFFHVRDFDENHVNFNELGRANFIILDGVSNPSTGLGEEVQKLLQRGGSAVYIPSLPDSSQKDLGLGGQKAFLSPFGIDLPNNWVRQEQILVNPTLHNSLLEGVFDRLPKNIDLPSVKQYLQFQNRNQGQKKILLSMQGKEPFLTEFKVGNGSFYVFSSPMVKGYNRFMLHPFFLPVFYKMAFQSTKSYPLYYTLGKKEIYKTESWTQNEFRKAKWIGDSTQIIPELENKNGMSLNLGAGPTHSGFFHLQIEGKNQQSFAFNEDRSESRLEYLDPDEMVKDITNTPLYKNTHIVTHQNEEEREAGFPLKIWKVCLILALICLAVEQALIRKKNPA